MKRRSGQQTDDGRAIRVGNEGPVRPPLEPDVRHGVGVHLRDDKWDLRVHPEDRAVVNHDGAPLDGGRAHLLRDGAAGAEEGDVDAVEALRAELLHDIVAALEGDAAAGGAVAGEHADAAVGEVAVGEDAKELLADGAGDADHSEGGAVVMEAHPDAGGRRRSAAAFELQGSGETARGGWGAERTVEVVTVSGRRCLHF